MKTMHTFACPVFALQNALASGNTLPRWSPRARLGLNLGPSPIHARNVYPILNLMTGCVSPQYHCRFDDFFKSTKHGGPDVSNTIWQKLVACIMMVKSCPTSSWHLRQPLLCSMRPSRRILQILRTTPHFPKLTLVPLTTMIVSLPSQLQILKFPVQLLHPAQGQQGPLHHIRPLRELLPPTLM